MSYVNTSSLASPFFPTLEFFPVHSCPISSRHGRSSSRSDSAFFEDLCICLASFPLSVQFYQIRVGAWSSQRSRGEGEGGTPVSQPESKLLPWANSAQNPPRLERTMLTTSEDPLLYGGPEKAASHSKCHAGLGDNSKHEGKSPACLHGAHPEAETKGF